MTETEEGREEEKDFSMEICVCYDRACAIPYRTTLSGDGEGRRKGT